MIKIEYEPKKPMRYRATCKCGCVFTYDETDKVNKKYGTASWDVVFCPHCGNDIGTPWDDPGNAKIEKIY